MMEKILTAIRVITQQRSDFVNRFWQIYDMITAWKEDMIETFKLGWVSFLDESMST